ncbi:penicillin-binding protein 1A [Aggregatibacter actinomycetemcomitans]|uniref:penicillin-binding protein 1A n=1 Tax=Aggregatibacter actinomycetemcomitans TaxID=714 RepID=UPI00022ADAB1|nr:penicillin-binding protein 1A [Aggregatibacter actinomycetemcomitans]KOE70088.1 penicillin-binding protein [Aggregatibacter actinomycetemcomitans serotype f str. D18P1]KYK87232.1 penicillin-binding protein 1a [Aggregatibacter actinomycetemcomitans serotype f str. SC29R]MBN6061402.1 penicillin-binding protein 1A [Aggregatibacter actinomycetemcomitans]OZV15462.1 penicillin-binding protein 1A [Aggregatibacter actinomycetemcomitans]UEL53882.1 penicillin-binding protein 1A [Aggregatibacter actin
MRIAKLILSSLLTLFILGGIVAGMFYIQLKSDLPDVETLKTVELQQPMQIYTSDGKLIGEVGEQRRIPVKLADIPEKLIQAVLATEDSRFYEHHGLDPIGIGRALMVAVTKGGASQGASTITQQLARNFFLTPEKSLIRKAKEAILAIDIENALDKNEILELYLNKIYLGYRSYGVAAAAKTYFGKELNQLTLSEMAVIAGLPKAPSTMNPLFSPKRALERRNVVLGRMLDQKYISKEEYDAALKAPIVASYHGAQMDFRADYVTEMVRQEMVKRFGEENAYTKGYKVYTTVLSKDQETAQKAVRDNLIAYDMRHGYRGGAPLWKKDEAPWDNDTIIGFLKKLPSSEPFIPAAAVSVAKSGAELLLASGDKITLPSSAMRWTGQANPVKVGDQIWIRKNDKGGWMLGQIPQANSALVSLNSDNGAIEAIVGGFSFEQSKFNRATQSLVQVGSSIKPFIYAAALEKGLTLSSVLQDMPIVLKKPGQKEWRPKNSPDRYDGPLRLRVGLGQSKNMIAIRSMQMAGIDFVADFLQRFGFKRDQYFASEALALGAASFTPLEMARGYAVFDNGGYLVDPYIIDKILDNSGKEIFVANPKVACPTCDNIPVIYGETEKLDGFKNTDLTPADEFARTDESTNGEEVDQGESVPDIPELQPRVDVVKEENLNLMADAKTNGSEVQYAPRVISGELAFLIRSALSTAIYGEQGLGWKGTSWRMANDIKRKDIGGKTGTTNNSKVAWYAGFGANLTTAVYIGFDDNRFNLGRGEAGAKSAMPAWIAYMKPILQDIPERALPMPANIVEKHIDLRSGLLANDGRVEYFIKGTEPTRAYVEERGYYVPSELLDGDSSPGGQPEELF